MPNAYTIAATIRGIAPLLHHKFPLDTLAGLMDGANRKSGSKDYSLEWMDTMYTSSDGQWLVQPASHIEGALTNAGAQFRVKGSRTKTYRQLMRAYVIVAPDEIVHGWNGTPLAVPDATLLRTPTEALEVNIQRVIVSRSAVARARLQINAGWELSFEIQVNDEQIRPDVLRTILDEAGHAIGIGDFRPRFGRFTVVHFAPQSPQA
jgi:hypothetical protein